MLTKTLYLTGLKCDYLLYLSVHKKDMLPEITESELFRSKQGTEIGNLAKTLHPDGIDLSGLTTEVNLKLTEEKLKDGRTIFEAGIKYENLLARIDILKPNKDGWDIIEVKSSTKVESHHIDDLSFQLHVARKAGLKINKVFVLHIDNTYILENKIDCNKLFKMFDVTEELNEINPEEEIKRQLEIINGEIPVYKISDNCNKPHVCSMTKECYSFLPEYNVTNLYYNKRLGFKLLEQNIQSMEDIPDDTKLSAKQRIQINSAKNNAPFIDKVKIKEFLDSLQEPYHYFDFETFAPGVPIYEGTKPYQQIPFQYSLHIQDGSELVHKEFLATNENDPRHDMIIQLFLDLKDEGSIIVYNKSFEISRLKEIASCFPEYEEKIQAIISRIVDLRDVFSNFYYYHPEQKGSASIKAVLPVLTDISYKNLGINNGELAYIRFYEAVFLKKNQEKTFFELQEYCKQDTFAEVRIIEELQRICGE